MLVFIFYVSRDRSLTPLQKYHVREHETTIYASSSDEKVSHMAGPGDVDAGRAWRTLRRPSDMVCENPSNILFADKLGPVERICKANQ